MQPSILEPNEHFKLMRLTHGVLQKKNMSQDQKERYVRWQNYRITQLSFSINLFVGFAVASLAYVINLKVGGGTHETISLDYIIIWWAVSAAFGCVATISRLLDYRYTAKKIKEGVKFNSFMAKCCSAITWNCFRIQIIAYVVCARLFIVGVVHAKKRHCSRTNFPQSATLAFENRLLGSYPTHDEACRNLLPT